MKRTILAAAAALLMATSAHAGNDRLLYSGKFWSTSYFPANSDGHPMCVMASTFGGSAVGAVWIKYTVSGGMWMQVWKSNWRIEPGAAVPLSATFLDFEKPSEPQTISTQGATAGSEGSDVTMAIRAEDEKPFLQAFGAADRLTISFPKGNEQKWTAKMDGSRAAAEWFQACQIKLLQQELSTTQPIVPRATQPVAPTQPVSKSRGNAGI